MMGCYFHKERPNNKSSSTDGERKQYSWDKRGRGDCSDYMLEDLIDSEVHRLPGDINGQQFIIQNCKNSTIYILDHLNAVVIDDCINCKIILGAVKGSVFLRDSRECVCVVACGQFRARDCRKLDIFLCCSTRPVLESSGSVHFGCYQLYYKGLQEHFLKAGLSQFNNEWSNIHDFTPVEGENNWCLLPATLQIEDYISPSLSGSLADLSVTFASETSVVPHTWGPHKIVTGEVCLVAFFCDGWQTVRVTEFINTIKHENSDCLLLMSKEKQMSPDDAERVFHSCAYERAVLRGKVVGLQFCGRDCLQMCLQIADRIVHGPTTSDTIYVSRNPKISNQQAECFFNTSINVNCL